MSEVYNYCYLIYVLVLIYLLGIMPSLFYLSIGLIASPLSQIVRRHEKSEMNDLFLTTVPIVQYIEVLFVRPDLILLDRESGKRRRGIVYYRRSVESACCDLSE